MAQPPDMEKSPAENVHQVDESRAQTGPSEAKRRTPLEKLGLYNVWVLAIGTAVIFAAIGFLAFLWAVSIKHTVTFGGIAQVPPLWMSIVRRNWASRVVTLATVLVRVALATQLCVFAALMAALILERVGASAQDLPLLSMIRCANTGPNALIWNVLHNIPRGFGIGYSVLIFIAILNALALQFMSTILLADFGNGLVIFHGYKESIMWGVDQSREATRVEGHDFWRSSQISYPTFAEYKKDPPHGFHGTDFVDTGTTFRGFLPFTNSTLRDNIMDYSGPMTVIDERVVCVKPTFSNAVFRIPDASDDNLSGELSFNNTHPDVVQYRIEKNFTCTMPHYWNERNTGYWHASICRLNLGTGRLPAAILPEAETRHNETNVWLIFNVTSPTDYNWTSTVPNPTDTVELHLNTLESPDGPWARIGHPNMTIDASLCLLNAQPDVYEVEASIANIMHTRDNALYWQADARTYNTSLARLQLDAIGSSELEALGYPANHTLSSEERGVLTLKPVADWNAVRAKNKYGATYQNMIHGSLDKLKPWNDNSPFNDSFVVTPTAGIQDAIHRNHMWVLQHALNQTNNPAVALQAITHIVMQTAYYDWFANYDLEARSTYSLVEPRYMPLIWRQFIAVVSLLGLHFVLLVIALVLFLTRTEMSLLGNTWQAVAQVHSTDTAAAVQHGTMATDVEVSKSIKNSGMDQGRVVIRRSERNGRLEAVSVIPDR